jgi:hypothetical protein
MDKWIHHFGPDARHLQRAYQVRVDGVRVKTMSTPPEGKREAIATLERDNPQRLRWNGEVTYIGWVAKSRVASKNRSSLLVEFQRPEDANAAIEVGIYWKGEPLSVVLFDSRVRLIQCFRCQQYGHIGRQCRAPARCSRCAGTTTRPYAQTLQISAPSVTVTAKQALRPAPHEGKKWLNSSRGKQCC